MVTSSACKRTSSRPAHSDFAPGQSIDWRRCCAPTEPAVPQPLAFATSALTAEQVIDVQALPPTDLTTLTAEPSAEPRPRIKLTPERVPASLLAAPVLFDDLAAIRTPGSSVVAEPTIQMTTSFEGTKQWDPPSPQIAIGPGTLIQMTNGAGLVFERNGGFAGGVPQFQQSAFFAVPGDYLWSGAPSLRFDASSGRFFAVMGAGNPSGHTGRLTIAVSTASDPSGTWVLYFLELPNLWPTGAHIALNDDKAVITAQGLDISDVGCRSTTPPPTCTDVDLMLVVTKADLTNLVAHPHSAAFAIPNMPYPDVFPAQSLSGGSTTFLTARTASSPTSLLVVFAITGTPSQGNVAIQTYGVPTAPVVLPPQVPFPCRHSRSTRKTSECAMPFGATGICGLQVIVVASVLFRPASC